MGILSSRRMSEDDEIELGAQKILEGWNVAGQPVEKEDPELETASTTCQKQETPPEATTNLDTSKTESANKPREKEKRKKESDPQASVEKLTKLALSLLEE